MLMSCQNFSKLHHRSGCHIPSKLCLQPCLYLLYVHHKGVHLHTNPHFRHICCLERSLKIGRLISSIFLRSVLNCKQVVARITFSHDFPQSALRSVNQYHYNFCTYRVFYQDTKIIAKEITYVIKKPHKEMDYGLRMQKSANELQRG